MLDSAVRNGDGGNSFNGHALQERGGLLTIWRLDTGILHSVSHLFISN